MNAGLSAGSGRPAAQYHEAVVRDNAAHALQQIGHNSAVIQYALNRWPALVYDCSDGQAEIDNLPAERALRGVPVGQVKYRKFSS